MSEFSFDPKSNKASPFQRLASGRVSSSNDSAPNSRSEGGRIGKIFNELGPPPAEEPSVATRIAPLEAAVTNISRSASSLEQVAAVGAEIAGSNAEASRATVRDVEAAANLAKDLRSRITANGTAAADAQVSNISPEAVERILN